MDNGFRLKHCLTQQLLVIIFFVDKFRQQRLAEMKQFQQRAKFGDVREITAIDYVEEVNKAGNGVWVVLHLYKTGYPLTMLPSENEVFTYLHAYLLTHHSLTY